MLLAVPLHGVTYIDLDFESDTPGAHPDGPFIFSPSAPTGDNGAVVIDVESSPVNPLGGQSLLVYDRSESESTHIRWDFAGEGINVSNVRVDFTFQRAFAGTDGDNDTGVKIGMSMAGADPTSSSRRPFEIRLLNDGTIRVNHADGTDDIDGFDVEDPNSFVILANGADEGSLSYDYADIGPGTLAPNSFQVFLNGTSQGSFGFHLNPSDEFDFSAQDEDLGRFGLYQDSSRQGEFVFDDLRIASVEQADIEAGEDILLFSADFEEDTAGSQPAGDFDFTPGTNTAENGIAVVDAASSEADPIDGKSLHIYDAGGSPTHLRWDFAGGENISAIRAELDFLRAYAVEPEDQDTGVKLSLVRAGASTSNSDFRPFEIRLMNDGRLRVEHVGGTDSFTPDMDADVPNKLVVLANSHDSRAVSYDYEDTGTGSMQPNTMHLFVNTQLIGIFGFHQTPDPANAPEIDFMASETDFGRMGIYQDSSRQGAFVIDNILIHELPLGGSGGGGDVQAVFYDSDFEDQTAGGALDEPFQFSPGSNTANNGVRVLGEDTEPVSPLGSGNAIYVYDFDGTGSSGSSTHMRWDFAGGANVSDLHVEFDFQRPMTASEIIGDEAGLEEEDIRVHFGVARAGDQTNNSDFRPFEIRFLNNGTIHVEAGDQPGDETAASYDTTNPNHVDILMNSHDTLSVPYDHEELGAGTLAPNSMRLFLNGEEVGTYAFHVTPDPENAPQINFSEQHEDLGRVAFYQDSNRQGAMVFDNLRIARLADVNGTPPTAPSGLAATVEGSSQITLDWTDNSGDESGFVIQRKSGDQAFVDIGFVPADAETYSDESLEPETTYTYRVLATNGARSEATAEVSATTEAQLAPLIESVSASQDFIEGTTVTLTVTASGVEPLSYQWYAGTSGDTASPVEGATGSSFTTGELSQAENYWVRVSNDHDTIDSETIALTPYQPVTLTVSSSSEFNTAMATAQPGDTLRIASGEYDDWVLEVEGEGTANAPITVGAEVPGEVILTGNSRLEISGRHLVVQNLAFVGTYTGNDDEIIQFRGDNGPAENSRLTNVAMYHYYPESGERTFWVSLYGKNNRVDHSYFEGHNVNGVTLVVWLDGEPNDHRIDHNHFHDRIEGGENGWETIRIGTSDTSMSTSRTTVEYNLFSYIDGEIEIISNKSGGNIYRGNTFFASQGMLTLRHGNDCIVDGNFFIGDGRSRTGGVRIIGENHRVTNNYFEGTTGRDGAAITISGGVPDAALNEYFPANNALIAFNTFVDVQGPAILHGAGYGTGGDDRSILPTGVQVAHNVFDAGSQTGGTFVVGEQPDTITYTGNLAFGRDPGVATDGWTIADPALTLDAEAGFLRPSEGSPVIDALTEPAFDVTLDIDGQARDDTPDLGADEASDAEMREIVGPLTAELVGIDWELPNDGGNWIADAVRIAEQTYSSEWFGIYWTTHWPWVYHAGHGYIWAHETGTTGLLFYDTDLGWIYTAQLVYPWIYHYEGSDWLYYHLDSSEPRWFYSDNQQDWVAIE